MKYIYKTVSLAGFLQDNKDARIGIGDWGYQLALANKASMAVEHLLNYYAKDGWEYVRSEEFFADFFKSSVARFISDKNNPRLQMFIFRQPYTEEMENRLAEEERRKIEETKEEDIVISLKKVNPDEITFDAGLWVYKNQKFSKRADAIEFAEAQLKSQDKVKKPDVTDARCPNCEALVNKLDKRCWKCDASFGGLSAWRPQPL